MRVAANIVYILLQNATYGEITSVTRAEGSGCTRSVAFANICLDSENADSALSFHLRSKLDFGDSLV